MIHRNKQQGTKTMFKDMQVMIQEQVNDMLNQDWSHEKVIEAYLEVKASPRILVYVAKALNT
jgi:hypothetical protein